MKKRYLLPALLALLLVVVLTPVACGADEASTTTTAAPTETTAAPTETTAAPTETTAAPTETTVAATGPIKVGHIVDLTGYQQNVGPVFKAGLDYALKDATIGGRPVEIIDADAKSDVAGAVDAARKLVEQDHVVAIFGPTQSNQKEAVSAYLKTVGIPAIYYNPTQPDITASDKWVIGSGGSTLQPGTVMADYVYNDLKYTKVDIIAADDVGYHSFFDPFITHFKELGGTIVQAQWTPFAPDDFTTYLAKLEPADALVTWYGGTAAFSLLNQFVETGTNDKMPMVGLYHGGMLDPYAINSIAEANPDVAKALVGTVATMAWNPESTDPVNLAYLEGITPGLKYGPPGDDGYACAVQGGQFFLQGAAATASDLSPDKLREALLKVSFTGPEGPQSFADGSQLATKPYYIVKVISVDIPNVGTVYKYGWVKTYDAVPPTGLTK